MNANNTTTSENAADTGGNAAKSSLWRRWRLPLLLLALFGLVLVWTGSGGPLPESRIGWGHDWSAAVDQASQSGRPILVFATADWCPPCRSMKQGPLQRDAVVQRIAAGFVPVKADVSDDASPGAPIATRFAVQYIPTLIVTDAQGDELARVSGYLGDDQLLAWLDQHAPR